METRETPKLNGWIDEEEAAMQTEGGTGGKPQGHHVVGGALGQGQEGVGHSPEFCFCQIR